MKAEPCFNYRVLAKPLTAAAPYHCNAPDTFMRTELMADIHRHIFLYDFHVKVIDLL